MIETSLHALLVDGVRKTLFYGFAIFILLMLIPVTREMILKFVGIVGGESSIRLFNTVIFVVKGIYRSHLTVLWHLSKKRTDVFLSPEEKDIGGINKDRKGS